VNSLRDLKLAPFIFLPARERFTAPKTRVAHGDLASICRVDPELLLATPFLTVDLTQPRIRSGHRMVGGVNRSGREGMVVKPLEFVSKGGKGWYSLR